VSAERQCSGTYCLSEVGRVCKSKSSIDMNDSHVDKADFSLTDFTFEEKPAYRRGMLRAFL